MSDRWAVLYRRAEGKELARVSRSTYEQAKVEYLRLQRQVSPVWSALVREREAVRYGS